LVLSSSQSFSVCSSYSVRVGKRVQGMSCGGCVSSVKRILESQPQVTAASVNLATETALVRVVSTSPDPTGWEKAKGQLAEVLAKHLTSCGFKSTVRGMFVQSACM
jgi:Cu+-exporting ATPase